MRAIHADHPAGTSARIADLNALTTPLRLRSVAMDDAVRIDVLAPSGLPNGWVIAPPV